jgi:hypothetical protein
VQLFEGAAFVVNAGPSLGHWITPDVVCLAFKSLFQVGASGTPRGDKSEGHEIRGDAVVRQVGADGSSVHGGGDTTAVLKRRFAVSDTSAFGLELGVKLPTAI